MPTTRRDARADADDARADAPTADDDGARDDATTPCCRFCFEGATDADDPLIAPCACRGGQEYIHAKCLLRWQRVVLVQQPTHPAFWGEDTRSDACGVCKTTFTTPPPTRAALMRSFTGGEIAAMVDEGYVLVSHEAFSAKLTEKLREMNPALRRVCSYEHWIRGTYLIVETRASSSDDGERGGGDDDVDDDTIVAVNLNGRCDVREVVRGESRLFDVVDDGERRETARDARESGTRVRVRLRREFEEGNERSDDDDVVDEDGDADDASGEDAANDDDEDPSRDDDEDDDDDDERAPRADFVLEVPEGAAENQEALFEDLQQLLSPFGPIFEVYQRFRKRRGVDDAYDEAAKECGVARQEIVDAVEIELFDGGPCDPDEIALCLVVGTDTPSGYTKVEGRLALANAISAAFRLFRADDARDGAPRLHAGDVAECAATADVPVCTGVLCGFSQETKTWNVASPFGVLRRTSSEFKVLHAATRAKVLCFFGTAQWNRSQLLGEIARGHWGLAKSAPVDVARANGAYQRVMDSGSLVFAPVTEMTEDFMRDELAAMARIRSSGQLERASAP